MRRAQLIWAGLILPLICGAVAEIANIEPAYGQVFATGGLEEPTEVYDQRPKAPLYRAYLPESVDLSASFPTPGYQGMQGSCVGWAVGYAARAYYSLARERRPANASSIPSPAYIYNSIARQAGCSSGTYVADALELLKRGVLSLADAPYDPNSCLPPSAADRARAGGFRIQSYFTVNAKRLDQIQAQLAQGNPVVIVLKTRRDFTELKGGQTYMLSDAPTYGPHAMAVVAYDDRRQAFKLINSWGQEWGEGGFGWVSYDVFRRDVDQAFAMRVAQADPPSPPVPLPQPQSDTMPSPPQPTPPPKPDPSPPPVPSPTVLEVKPNPPLPNPSPAPTNITRVTPDKIENSPKPTPPPTPPLPTPPRPQPPPVPVTFDFPSCGSVAATDGVVQGYVGTEADLAEVKKRASSIGARMEVALRPWPQCEALMTLDRGLRATDRPQVRIVRPDPSAPLVEGEALLVEVQTPSVPTFLDVTYIQADGSAVHLVQSDNQALSQFPPHTKVLFGDGRNGGPRFTVSRPFGREIVIATTSPAPLFSQPRPDTETEREYLTALRAAVLARPNPNLPSRTFSSGVDTVVTMERKQ